MSRERISEDRNAHSLRFIAQFFLPWSTRGRVHSEDAVAVMIDANVAARDTRSGMDPRREIVAIFASPRTTTKSDLRAEAILIEVNQRHMVIEHVIEYPTDLGDARNLANFRFC